jgi:hypothetical protein
VRSKKLAQSCVALKKKIKAREQENFSYRKKRSSHNTPTYITVAETNTLAFVNSEYQKKLAQGREEFTFAYGFRA